MTELPRIAAYKPHYAELEKDKRYFWCACGLSNNQPYCDGSHNGTGIEPICYVGKTDGEEVLFCACKKSSDSPFCDGSHNNLLEHYETDDPDSEANQAIPAVEPDSDGIAHLDGDCFVASTEMLSVQDCSGLQVSSVIGPHNGALYQAQFMIRANADWSDPIEFGQHDVLLFVADGGGCIEIGGKQFQSGALSGAFVKPGEAFALRSDTGESFTVFASVCPAGATLNILDSMPDIFDDSNPERVIPFDKDNRQDMADRFFQLLVDETIGCANGTQFIGEIPRSKAVLHRHLYEESLIVLKGSGVMWTTHKKTPVKAGDVIFLPRKEPHSLECTSPDGMLVAGVIYPGNNPAINY